MNTPASQRAAPTGTRPAAQDPPDGSPGIGSVADPRARDQESGARDPRPNRGASALMTVVVSVGDGQLAPNAFSVNPTESQLAQDAR